MDNADDDENETKRRQFRRKARLWVGASFVLPPAFASLLLQVFS